MKRKRIRLSNSNLRENILNEETIDNLFSLLIPVGTILPYAGNRLLDELINFTLCDGKELARLEYPKLFNVIGTNYGVGDGSTTFNVPDLTSRFLEGSNIAGTIKEAGIPNIIGEDRSNYIIARPEHMTGAFSLYNGVNTNYRYGNISESSSSWGSGFKFSASNCSPVYGKSDTVQPASVTVKYIIRCK